MKLHHYSEDPDIACFHSHIAKTSSIQHEAFVWAIVVTFLRDAAPECTRISLGARPTNSSLPTR